IAWHTRDKSIAGATLSVDATPPPWPLANKTKEGGRIQHGGAEQGTDHRRGCGAVGDPHGHRAVAHSPWPIPKRVSRPEGRLVACAVEGPSALQAPHDGKAKEGEGETETETNTMMG